MRKYFPSPDVTSENHCFDIAAGNSLYIKNTQCWTTKPPTPTSLTSDIMKLPLYMRSWVNSLLCKFYAHVPALSEADIALLLRYSIFQLQFDQQLVDQHSLMKDQYNWVNQHYASFLSTLGGDDLDIMITCGSSFELGDSSDLSELLYPFTVSDAYDDVISAIPGKDDDPDDFRYMGAIMMRNFSKFCKDDNDNDPFNYANYANLSPSVAEVVDEVLAECRDLLSMHFVITSDRNFAGDDSNLCVKNLNLLLSNTIIDLIFPLLKWMFTKGLADAPNYGWYTESQLTVGMPALIENNHSYSKRFTILHEKFMTSGAYSDVSFIIITTSNVLD